MNRRALLTAAASTVALAACSAVTSNTTNGVTTVTVNVAKIDAWGQAFSNAGALILALPGVSTLPVAAAITAAIALAKTDLAAFDTSAGGNVTLTFDATSVPAAIQSVLNDGKTLLTDVGGVPSALPAATSATANEYVAALQTIVSIFQATISAMVSAPAPGAEAKALATLGVKA